MRNLIILENNQLSMTLSPYDGASILSLKTREGVDILRPSPESFDDIRQTACFPLVPHVHRIGNAQFSWLGKTYTLSQNMAPELHHIHGEGWLNHHWQVTENSKQHVRLSLTYPASDWPFSFDAQIGYQLSENTLKGVMKLTNCEDFPTPGGIGFHPYFPKTKQSKLIANAKRVMLVDNNMMPITVSDDDVLIQDLTNGTLLHKVMDNCFSFWTGTAVIVEADYQLILQADKPFDCLQCYAPDDDFFCVEPVSHLPNAVNIETRLKTSEKMYRLKPHETLAGEFTLQYQPNKQPK